MSEELHAEEFPQPDQAEQPQEQDTREQDIVKAETLAHAVNDSMGPRTLEGFRATRAHIDDIGETAARLASTGELDSGAITRNSRLVEESARFREKYPTNSAKQADLFTDDDGRSTGSEYNLEKRLATTGYTQEELDEEEGRYQPDRSNFTARYKREIQRLEAELASAEASGIMYEQELARKDITRAERSKAEDTSKLLDIYSDEQAHAEQGIANAYKRVSKEAEKFEAFYELNPDKFSTMSPKEFLDTAKSQFELKYNVSNQEWGVKTAQKLTGEYSLLTERMDAGDVTPPDVSTGKLDAYIGRAFGYGSDSWRDFTYYLDEEDGLPDDIDNYAFRQSSDPIGGSVENVRAYAEFRKQTRAQFLDTTPRQLVQSYSEFAQKIEATQEAALNSKQAELNTFLAGVKSSPEVSQ